MIGEPFAATRPVLVGQGLDRSLDVGGTTLTSAPVSIRNWSPDMGSRMWRRIDLAWWLAVRRLFIGISPDRVGSFPILILILVCPLVSNQLVWELAGLSMSMEACKTKL